MAIPNLSESYKKSVQELKKQNEKRILSTTNDIFDALVVEPSKEHAVLPEPIFKEVFLPYFSGQKNIAEDKDIIAKWVQVAGVPGAEVDVIDQNGTVQFTVPPVFDSGIIETVKRKLGESVSDIYTLYNLHSNNSPVIGERVLANAFENKIPTMIKPSEALSENQARWNTIFERYNGSAKASAKQAPEANDSDVEYE
jgi:hypothetical protein